MKVRSRELEDLPHAALGIAVDGDGGERAGAGADRLARRQARGQGGEGAGRALGLRGLAAVVVHEREQPGRQQDLVGAAVDLGALLHGRGVGERAVEVEQQPAGDRADGEQVHDELAPVRAAADVERPREGRRRAGGALEAQLRAADLQRGVEVRGDGRVVERVHPRHGAVEGGDIGAAIVVAVEDARQGRERLRGRLEHRPAVAGIARDVTRPRAQLARTVA